MILIVDDDEEILAQSSQALAGAGYEPRTFLRAVDALEAAGEEPELIISDVLMPEMGGIAFREAYSDRYPQRQTPFLFLSSLDSPSDVVRGLEVGADDYLAKPVSPAVLVAKVKAHLRRGRRQAAASFLGDLAKFPFAKVLQFCETQELQGEAEVTAKAFTAKLRFRAGTVRIDSEQAADDVARCLELTEGQFLLTSTPVDFSSLQQAALVVGPKELPRERPMGRLSGVRAGSRLFQIQTEFSTSPSCQAVTVVMAGGKAVLKRTSPPTKTFELAAAEKLVAEQHLQVEQEVREKIEGLAAQKSSPAPAGQFDRLFDEGLSKFLAKDYPGALSLWEQARELEPGNKILEVNLGIARKKVAAAQG